MARRTCEVETRGTCRALLAVGRSHLCRVWVIASTPARNDHSIRGCRAGPARSPAAMVRQGGADRWRHTADATGMGGRSHSSATTLPCDHGGGRGRAPPERLRPAARRAAGENSPRKTGEGLSARAVGRPVRRFFRKLIKASDSGHRPLPPPPSRPAPLWRSAVTNAGRSGPWSQNGSTDLKEAAFPAPPPDRAPGTGPHLADGNMPSGDRRRRQKRELAGL